MESTPDRHCRISSFTDKKTGKKIRLIGDMNRRGSYIRDGVLLHLREIDHLGEPLFYAGITIWPDGDIAPIWRISETDKKTSWIDVLNGLELLAFQIKTDVFNAPYIEPPK